MSKRRRAMVGTSKQKTYGDLGERQTLKPVGNKDVPSDARIVNIHIIGNGQHDMSELYPADGDKQQYGDVFEYQLPEYYQDPLTREAMIPPDKMLPTNEIYDVDFDGYAKTPDLGNIVVYDNYITNDQTGWDVAKGKPITGRSAAIAGNTVDVDPVSAAYAMQYRLLGKSNTPRPFFLYVVGKGKQKVLGEWIQHYTVKGGVSHSSATEGQMVPIDSWLFDRFCAEVKPVWAKLFMPTVSDITVGHMMSVTGGPSFNQPDLVPLPDQPLQHTGFEWKTREFHRNQDYGGQLTATDSYARKLLIGNMGTVNMDVFHFARFRIYYQPTKVQADTLYFQSQQEFIFEQFRGDRHEYGKPSWQDIAIEPGQTETLTDAKFKGVVTCQEGTITYFKDGALRGHTSTTNVLIEDAETGQWY